MAERGGLRLSEPGSRRLSKCLCSRSPVDLRASLVLWEKHSRGRWQSAVFSGQCSWNCRASEGFSGVASRRCVPDLLDLRTSMLVCRSATACNLGRAFSGDVSVLLGLEDFWAPFPVAYAHRQGLWRPSGPESQRRGTFCRRFAASGRFVDCTILGLSPEAICWRSFAAEDRKLSSCGGLSALIRVIRGSLIAEHFQGTSCVYTVLLVLSATVLVLEWIVKQEPMFDHERRDIDRISTD